SSRLACMLCFFFSSRRRHTRFSRDWSSDVCSSDLAREIAERAREAAAELPQMAQKVRNSLASVRTRVDVVANRVEAVREAMRVLLRTYSQACWQDLKGAPEAIEAGADRARERLNEASAHVARAE